MKSRGKHFPAAELIVVMGVLLPISACSWAESWRRSSKPAEAASDDKEAAEEKKEMPKVKMSREAQQLYNRYHTPPGRKLGVSDESQSIEERLGVN